MVSSQINIIGNIVASLEDAKTGRIHTVRGKNIVTYSGDLYYAQVVSRMAPTYDLAVTSYMQLGRGTTAPTKSDTGCGTLIVGSAKLIESMYPVIDDQDPLNTGAGIYTVSYKYVWDAAEVVEADIAECIIGDNTDATPTALLMHGLFTAPFEKTESQILRVFVNHTVLGS